MGQLLRLLAQFFLSPDAINPQQYFIEIASQFCDFWDVVCATLFFSDKWLGEFILFPFIIVILVFFHYWVSHFAILVKSDDSLSRLLVEITSNTCDALLDHAFLDSPAPSRLRYCLNALTLKRKLRRSDFRQTYANFL